MNLQARRHGVVAVVFRRGQFLAIRRSRHVVAPGAVCFPGGGVESGESEDQAVSREMMEELGVHAIPMRRIWESLTSRNVFLGWWRTAIAEPIRLNPNSKEVADVSWLSSEELVRQEGLLNSNCEFLQAYARGEFQLEV